MRRSNRIFALVLLLVGFHERSANAQIAIPGPPKGHLPTELLQCRSYCRATELQLRNIEAKFPTLEIEVLSAKAAWSVSPFAKGADAIEADIKKQTGSKGIDQLQKVDAETLKRASANMDIKTEGEAREFLFDVGRRAKGEIEFPMVRGNLLWHYAPYQNSPDLEFTHGYVVPVDHTMKGEIKVSFKVPMSWKIEDTPEPSLVAFRNCYGHGNVWCTIFVSELKSSEGNPVTAEDRFAAYSRESLEQEYLSMGIKLKTFSKTKLNGMPALMFTREQPVEQLDVKATRAAQAIRVFHKGYSISFQINTLGPTDSDLAEKRIKKNELLFKSIARSLVVK